MSAATILLVGRARVAAGWCQGGDAQDAFGNAVDLMSPAARHWSLLGALVNGSGGRQALENDLRTLNAVALASLAIGVATGEDSLKSWNDDPARTQAEVVAAFDAALELLDRFRAPTQVSVLQ